jgi:hypothetical protein
VETLKAMTEDEPKLRALGPVNAVAVATKSMGMELLYPPDVSGWDGGPNWISSATMVERIKWADRLFGPGAAPVAGNRQPAIRYPAAALFTEAKLPGDAVKTLVSIFDAQFSPAKMKQLEAAANEASGDQLNPRTANAVASAVCRLIFGSPEFQFC